LAPAGLAAKQKFLAIEVGQKVVLAEREDLARAAPVEMQK